jgi:hypothetical protein
MDEAADPYRYALQQSVERTPGQVYNYCGAAPTLLQGVLQSDGRLLLLQW